ncbi:hypothetical protein SmJEL517_g00518 [Synchytrium microbalum]|uniref:C2H2-type domain-containing protein n=1 Tax=Synchytrium microbalum TaxID=1806994 RepID=A0A507CDY4_9FUNG|nr:uncharacterized protein SmJEL517_g00518 [Synchytrium microbalum]TPX37721.1 hypothetical protein SmJEL517_g00518 [Synchytrium microbalum]
MMQTDHHGQMDTSDDSSYHGGSNYTSSHLSSSRDSGYSDHGHPTTTDIAMYSNLLSMLNQTPLMPMDQYPQHPNHAMGQQQATYPLWVGTRFPTSRMSHTQQTQQHYSPTSTDSPHTPQLFVTSPINSRSNTPPFGSLSPPASPSHGHFRLNPELKGAEHVEQFVDYGEHMGVPSSQHPHPHHHHQLVYGSLPYSYPVSHPINDHHHHHHHSAAYGLAESALDSINDPSAAAYGLGLSALDDEDDEDDYSYDQDEYEVSSSSNSTDITTPASSISSSSRIHLTSAQLHQHRSAAGGMVGATRVNSINSDAASIITTSSTATSSTTSSAEPFKCECGKVFEKATQLRAHAKIHSCRERSFVCEHCSKAFLRGRDLRRHSVIHQEDFVPYVCENCRTTFTRSDALHRHIKALRCKTN